MKKKRKKDGSPQLRFAHARTQGNPFGHIGSHGTCTTVHYYSKKKGREPQLPVAHARTRGKLFDVT